MLKRLFQILLLGLLAWFLSPVLNVLLPFPTEGMMRGLLDLNTESGQSWLKVWRYVFWIIMLALLFRYTQPLLSFALPIAKRYGTTKPMRRFQWIFSELFFLCLAIFLVGGIFAVVNARMNYVAEARQLRESVKATLNDPPELERIKTEIQANRMRTYKIVEDIYGTKHSDFWPQFRFDDINDYPGPPSQRNYPVDHYTGRLLVWSKLYSEVKRHNKVLNETPYLQLFSKQLSLHNEKREWENRQRAFQNLSETEQYNIIKSEAENQFWIIHGSTFQLLHVKFMEEFWGILLLSCLTYLPLRFFGRHEFGAAFDNLLLVFQQGRFGRGGSARFSGLFEEWTLLYKTQKHGLFLGRSLYNPFLNIGMEDSRHMLTIAGSRAGKGATAIIPNLLLWEGSALVIDPKGTNAAVTAHRRKQLGQNVYIIDPFRIVKKADGQYAHFNPLDALDLDSPSIREEINMITEALVVPDQNQKERHWDDGAKTIIAGMIGHLVTSDKYENPTLSMLRDMISCLPEEQDEIWAAMALNNGAGRLPKDAANRVIRGIEGKEISSIISNADKHTEWLSSPAMQETLGKSNFLFSDLKDEPTTIYLVLPPHLLETHNRFLRLFVNLALAQMSVGGKSRVPVLLMLDEFLALGRMEEVEKAFGLMAGYNLTLWPFVQDLGRLKDLYGKSVNAFIANSRAVQVFGVADEESKEFVSKYLGDHRLEDAPSKKMQGRISVPLRNPSEVSQDIAAETGRQYILRAGKAPLVLEKVPYYNSAPANIFDGLYTPDPDFSNTNETYEEWYQRQEKMGWPGREDTEEPNEP